MPPERNENIYLHDIFKAVSKIIGLTKNMNFVMFSKDERTIDAVLYNFTMIGEAARHIPETTRQAYPDIPWMDMQDMRNLVIHEYFGVDLQIVWKTIKDDLPPLLDMLMHALKKSAPG